PAFELPPPPPPLRAQTLVDMLKQPLCVGEARRLVLGQLARHYGRPFADQWEFVEYAQEHKLGLDLTSPPRQPGQAGITLSPAPPAPPSPPPPPPSQRINRERPQKPPPPRDAGGPRGEFRFADEGGEILVFDRQEMNRVTEEIMEENGIAPTRRGSAEALKAWKKRVAPSK